MTAFLIELVSSQNGDLTSEDSLRYQLFQKCEDDWKVLCKALEDCEKFFSNDWGEMDGVHDQIKPLRQDKVINHSPPKSDSSSLSVMG